MDKKFTAMVIIAVIALIVAAVSLAISFTVLSAYSPKQTTTETPTHAPSSYLTPTPTTATPIATPITVTGPFDPKIAVTYFDTATNSMSPFGNCVNTTNTIPSGSYLIDVNITNAASNAPSNDNYKIQFIFTEKNTITAQASDIIVKLYTAPEGPQFLPPFKYPDYTTELTPTVNGNTLIFTCAPSGGGWAGGIYGLSADGFSITSGFKEVLEVKVILSVSSQLDLVINLILA